MLQEVIAASSGAASFQVAWKASRLMRVEAMEGVNRTAPCMITLCVGPAGSREASAGIALAQGATQFAGLGVIWTGAETLQADEEIWALFNNSDVGDVLDLTVKVVPL
jgi:hypothetical protein